MGLYYNSGRYVGRKILLYEDKRKMNTLITEHSSSSDSSLESLYGSDVGDVVIGQKRVGATNVVRRTRATPFSASDGTPSFGQNQLTGVPRSVF